jgi:hypothetical protein
MFEDRVSHGKYLRVSGECLQRLDIRAAAARWVGIGMERALLHSPEDLFLREFGWIFVCHLPLIVGPNGLRVKRFLCLFSHTVEASGPFQFRNSLIQLMGSAV